MASIPLTALSIKPAEPPPNALETMRSMQQLQAGKQEQEINALKIQQAKRDQQEQATINQTIGQTGGDLEKAIPLLVGKVSQTKIDALKKSDLDHKKELSEYDEKAFALTQKKHGALADLYQQAQNLPDDQYAQSWPQIAASANALEPKLRLNPAQPVPKQQLSQLGLGLSVSENYIKAEAEKRAAQKEPLEQQKLKAETEKAQAEASKISTEAEQMKQFGGLTTASADAKYRFLAQRQALGTKLSAEDSAYMKAYEKQKEIVPKFNFNIQAQGVQGGATPTDAQGKPLQGEDLYKSFGGKAGIVRAVVEGRQAPPASFAQKSPYWQDVMAKVYQVDPEFNEQRAQLRKAYTLGPQSKEINAINTALGHVGVMNDAIDALNNGDVRVLNAIGNRLGIETGNDAATAFKTIVHRVGPEISKAYIGAGGSAGERGTDEKDFDPNLGPKQLKTNTALTVQLLRSKISALENQWNQNKAPGMPSFEEKFIMPEAKSVANKLSPKKESSGGKTLSMAQIQQAAKDHGVSVDEAKRQAIAAGYQIQ